jgi:hypothetical protein
MAQVEKKLVLREKRYKNKLNKKEEQKYESVLPLHLLVTNY